MQENRERRRISRILKRNSYLRACNQLVACVKLNKLMIEQTVSEYRIISVTLSVANQRRTNSFVIAGNRRKGGKVEANDKRKITDPNCIFSRQILSDRSR